MVILREGTRKMINKQKASQGLKMYLCMLGRNWKEEMRLVREKFGYPTSKCCYFSARLWTHLDFV